MVKILMGLKGRGSTKINFFADFAIFPKLAVCVFRVRLRKRPFFIKITGPRKIL